MDDIPGLHAMAKALGRQRETVSCVKDFLAGVSYVRALLREPVQTDRCAARARERTAHREEAFLQTVERAIFAYPNSPYRPLLDAGGFDLPRLKTLVSAQGLEQTLHTLARQGVYVSIEEYKGTRELHRRNLTYRFDEAGCQNPLITSGLVASGLTATSGGTRSKGLVTTISPANHRMGAEHLAVALEAYGLQGAPVVVWLSYTHGASLWAVLALLAIGNPVPYWFSQLPATVSERRGTYARYLGIRAAAPLYGRRVPPSTHLPIGQESSVVRLLRDGVRRGQRYGVFTTPSAALRLALAAKRLEETLEGITFVTVAEPLTPVKLAAIQGAGARAFSSLGFTEFGRATYGCASPDGIDDSHICRDVTAVIQRRRPVDQVGTEIDALLFTALQPDCRKVLLNVETGDYATVTRRHCGCRLGALGWTEQLTGIRSFEKLNAEGPPFAGSKLIALVEEVLPRRFGGDPTSYQLLEEEDEDGFTRLSVVVHPLLGSVDEQAVLDCAIETLWTTHGMTSTRIWAEAGIVRVRRAEPMLTKAGKFLPLHHLKPDRRHPKPRHA